MDTCCPSLSEISDYDSKPNKLSTEIECGINIRKNRNQEKDIVLATNDPSYLYEQVRDKRSKKRRRRKHKLLVRQEKPKKQSLNRNACSNKEYFEFLSIPKHVIPKYIYKKPVQVKRKRDKGNKTVSPRFAQLALPKKRRILCSWIDYKDVLSAEQILFLKELLNREESLSLHVAKGYFKRLDARKRKLRKVKLKKLRQVVLKKPEKSKVVKEIDILAKRIVKFFSMTFLQDVKYSHMMITDLIRSKLVNFNLIRPYKRSDIHNAAGQCFFDTVDQLSVWLETHICYADLDALLGVGAADAAAGAGTGAGDGDGDEGSMGTSSGSSYTEILDAEEGDWAGRGELELEIDYDALRRMREGMRGVGKGEEQGIKVEQVEKEMEEMATKEEEQEAEDGKGKKGLGEGEGLDSLKGRGEKEYAEESYVLGRGILDDLLNFVISDEVQEFGEVAPEEVEEQLHIEEHSPDAMCCVTLKTWATWLVTVAQNTHSWCQWIQDVIAKIRFFAAVLKGEIKTKDGKTRILYKEEWVQFKDNLDRDIKAWLEYKSHVARISGKIIEHCQNKRIICCKACLDANLIISAETAHQVTEQLVEALNTTAYWRKWLDAVVTEANKLASLELDLPTTPEGSSIASGSLESYGVFDIVEIKSPSQVTEESSDTSVYIIEEL